ncbi:MAG: class I SAM-dependent methyltransferase [Desulfobacterales bacterium]
MEYTFPIPKKNELKRFYQQYNDFRADPEIVFLNARKHINVLKKYGWSYESLTLDFGAGKGEFVKVAGKKCYGIEWNSIPSGQIKKSIKDLHNFKWDFITLWGVLEHLPDPLDTMARLIANLRYGGYIALTTVNAESEIPYYYKPPEHLSYWTRRAFEYLCADLGLSIIDYYPYTMFQFSTVYVERLLNRTPEKYRSNIQSQLPKIIEIPTNEVCVIIKKL